LEGIGSDLILKYYPDICPEELRKAKQNLSQDSRFSGRDLNPIPPDYDAGELTTRLRRTAVTMSIMTLWVVTPCVLVRGYKRFKVLAGRVTPNFSVKEIVLRFIQSAS
jgi:hypothetical protein